MDSGWQLLGTGEWGTDYAAQKHASRTEQHLEGTGLAAATGVESVHHYWPDEEGDREGWGDHQTCNHKGDDAEDQQ